MRHLNSNSEVSRRDEVVFKLRVYMVELDPRSTNKVQ